jgi:hypothetical protein
VGEREGNRSSYSYLLLKGADVTAVFRFIGAIMGHTTGVNSRQHTPALAE